MPIAHCDQVKVELAIDGESALYALLRVLLVRAARQLARRIAVEKAKGAEVVWRQHHPAGSRPPGSTRTKRLRKKRNKALFAFLDEVDAPGALQEDPA